MTVKSFDKHNMCVLLDPPADQVGANSTWVQPFANSEGGDRAVFMLITGLVDTNTITFELWQATTSGGAGPAKVITGTTITPIAIASAGEIVTIEIGPGALDDKNGFTWVQARVGSGAANLWTLVYIRHNLRYPGLFAQDATYTQQVRVYT